VDNGSFSKNEGGKSASNLTDYLNKNEMFDLFKSL